MTRVVTCFLRRGGEVLLVRRSESVGTYAGLWGGVSGYVERPPEETTDEAGCPPALADARREIAEETGLSDATLVRAGDPLEIRDGDRTWTVHPFLFDAPAGAVDPNGEIAAHEWVQPPAMRDRETVPGLWAAYERVAPTVESVRGDEAHGSAYVSLRALEVLRDGAATAGDWEAVAEVAHALRTARPSMTALAVRIDRVMAEADRTPEAVCERASAAVTAAVGADEAAAATAAEALADADAEAVITLSRSGTVLDALRRLRPRVVVAESRPGGEGIGVAAELAREGIETTLTTDAAVPGVVAGLDGSGASGASGESGESDGDGETDASGRNADDRPKGGGGRSDRSVPDVDAALVGADSVLADGDVVNKVGTRGLALSAAREGVPLYVIAARDKIDPGTAFRSERADDADLRAALDRRDGRDGDVGSVAVAIPRFDRTPADLVTGVLTEEGSLDAEGVRAVADEHRELAAWDEG